MERGVIDIYHLKDGVALEPPNARGERTTGGFDLGLSVLCSVKDTTKASTALPDPHRNLTCTLIRRTMYAVMAYKALTVDELLALMKKIQGEKTNTEFAADLVISKQYLSDLYSGRKIPSDTVSAVFGFEQKILTRYVPSTTAAKPEAPSVREPSRKKTRRARKRNS